MPVRFRLALVLSLAGTQLMAAEGSRLVSIGAAQAATVGAGVAHAQDGTWISLNPAALVEVEPRVDAGFDVLRPTASMTPAGPLANSGAGDMSDTRLILTDLALITTRMAGGTASFGMYSLAGLALDFPRSRTAAGASTGYDRRDDVQIAVASSAYARTIGDGCALGLALNLEYAQARSDAANSSLTETSGSFDRQHAFGGGAIIGIQEHWDNLRLGASYATRQWMQTFDNYRDILAGPFDQPPVFQAGIAYRIGDIEPLIDYRFIQWTNVRLYGDDDGLGWRDQHILKVGVNAYLSPAWILRAGFSTGNAPIDESAVFTNGLSPLVTTTHAGAGASWKPSSTWQLTVAYQHAFARSITDDGSDVGGGGKGTEIGLVIDMVSLQVGWLL